MHQNKDKTAFSLAEITLVLGIIAVISVLTLPALINNVKDKEFKTATKKAYSTLSNALDKGLADAGYNAKCFYWDKKPYGNAVCVERNANGDCTKNLMSDGSPLPSDYNGPRTGCANLIAAMEKNLNTVKICRGNAYAGGCTPKYNGIETVKKNNNPDLSDYDANVSTSGCSGFRTAGLMTRTAYVLADGMIVMLYSATAPVFFLDVNGKKGPNKWGYDIHTLQIAGDSSAQWFRPDSCSATDAGGKTTREMLFGK